MRQAFVECGDIQDVRIVRDSRTGAGKGFGFILFKERDGVMFALKKNKTEFHGRQLRVFPSSENPQLGQLKRANKGRPGLYSFSGITAKKTTTNDHKGKKKQAAIKRHQDSQGFGKMSVRKNYKQTRKNSKCQNRGNCKINNRKT